MEEEEEQVDYAGMLISDADFLAGDDVAFQKKCNKALYLYKHKCDPDVNEIDALEQSAALGWIKAIREIIRYSTFQGISFKRRFPFIKQFVIDLHETLSILHLHSDSYDAVKEGDFSLVYDFGYFILTHLSHILPSDLNYSLLGEVILHYTQSKSKAQNAVLAWCWCAKRHLNLYSDLVRLIGLLVWSGRKTWKNMGEI